MFYTSLLRAAAVATLAVAPAVADATVINTRYDFTGSFQPDALVPQISGYFTVARNTDLVEGALLDVNVRIGSTLFTTANSGGGFFPGEPGDTVARVGGITSNPFDTFRSLSTGETDYAVVIILDDPTSSYFFYTLNGWAGLGEAYGQDGGFTFTATDLSAGAVPEPASWALMIGGFGLVGGTLRRRSMKVRYATA